MLLLLGLTAPVGSALATHCTLGKAGELQVTMIGLRPMVHAAINGTDALFLADSGAFFNTLSPAATAGFGLNLRAAPFGFSLKGIGGESRALLTTVKTFSILNLTVHDVEFVVAGNDLGGGAVGLLGQNIFRVAGDVEYDLANGVIKLMRPKDCSSATLAYWATSVPYGVIDIEHATAQSPFTRGAAFVNGTKIQVMFDTGSSTSVLSLDAAKRAGITPESAGVVSAPAIVGMGRYIVSSWIAPFSSFKIGDEEIRNTRLRIGTLGLGSIDMLIGADFFLSHRVYVSNAQRKLYFTYNGGPVFNLASAEPANPSDHAPDDSPGSPAASGSVAPTSEKTDQPGDAAGFGRRGAAFAARGDFGHAIADLTRACELNPAEPSYFYQRGMAYWSNKQPDPAMVDFEQALKLKPNHLSSLVARAELHLQRKEIPAAVTDLDGASRAAPNEADIRPTLGDLYLRAGEFGSAVDQYTLWIDSHGHDDVRRTQLLMRRCWSHALWGRQLDLALSHRDAALKSSAGSIGALDGRALVRLRRGDYDGAIADSDRAVSVGRKDAWGHYISGVAKLRKGMIAEGQADLAAATAVNSGIAERAAKVGIDP